MTKLNKALLAGVATLTLTLSAQARVPWERMHWICDHNAFCLYLRDAGSDGPFGRDFMLGTVRDVGSFWRQIGDQLYFAGYTALGLTVDLQLYYAEGVGSDCRGKPMVASGYINEDGATVTPMGPPFGAQWDGQNFWGPIGKAVLTAPQSTICMGVSCNGYPSNTCLPYTATLEPFYAAFAPAGVVETPKPKPVNCIATQDCIVVE